MEIHACRSVWDAVADSPDEAANLKRRSQLMDAVKGYIGPKASPRMRRQDGSWCRGRV